MDTYLFVPLTQHLLTQQDHPPFHLLHLFLQASLIILLLFLHLYLLQIIPCLIPQSYISKLQKDVES